MPRSQRLHQRQSRPGASPGGYECRVSTPRRPGCPHPGEWAGSSTSMSCGSSMRRRADHRCVDMSAPRRSSSVASPPSSTSVPGACRRFDSTPLSIPGGRHAPDDASASCPWESSKQPDRDLTSNRPAQSATARAACNRQPLSCTASLLLAEKLNFPPRFRDRRSEPFLTAIVCAVRESAGQSQPVPDRLRDSTRIAAWAL